MKWALNRTLFGLTCRGVSYPEQVEYPLKSGICSMSQDVSLPSPQTDGPKLVPNTGSSIDLRRITIPDLFKFLGQLSLGSYFLLTGFAVAIFYSGYYAGSFMYELRQGASSVQSQEAERKVSQLTEEMNRLRHDLDSRVLEITSLRKEKDGLVSQLSREVEQRKKRGTGPPSPVVTADHSDEWRRLTDSDRTKLSVALSNGSKYRIEIFRSPSRDCMRLAEDLYDFFTRVLQWRVDYRPQSSLVLHEIPPGIRVTTVPDNVPSAQIKNIRERSGALLVISALEQIGLPVIYETRSGGVDDLVIHFGNRGETRSFLKSNTLNG